ncbi:MAG: hypothetical protein MR794_05065 [Bacteroidales bacterium]|nr:hypothetical protein [Bacteroidales bacterium]
MTFTLGGDDTNGWTFSTDNYGGIAGMLAATSSNSNRLGVVASPGNNGKWAITFSSNLAKPVAKGTFTRKYMKYNYNSGSPIFNCYSSSGSESVYIYKLAASCDNKVTISKGSETNGTFTLDKTGEQNACDALSVTVTPSPAEHFHVASVSATNPATTGTAGEAVDNGDGTWTITYSANAKGASTINVTFAEDSKASITLSEAGATTTDATTYYVGDSYILPSTTEASCGTKVLVGWSTVTVSETDIKPASNFYEKGETVTLEASQTFYAVFANASGGGGGAPTAYTAGDEGTYVLAIYVSGTWYALPANPTVSSGKISGVEITVSNTGGVDYVTNADGFEWTIANATNGQTISDGSNYIYHSNGGSSGTNLTYGNGTTYTWTIESEQNGLTFKGTNGTTVGSRGLLASGTTFGGYSLSNEDASGYYRIHVLPIGGGTTYSAYSTTCQACAAPTSVTITGTNKYLGGQTISLTATPEGGTGTPSYQWQKKISEVWTNLENDGSISGVTSNNLKISSCSYVNSGGYRCIVSTGDGCETKSHADDTNGYGVHVFSLTGGYSGGDWSAHDITWTSGTTGTATIHLNASSTYMFKVFSNNGYYYGNGENNYIIQPVSWDCGINNHDMRLFTGPEGDYTFTVNIEHGLDGSPYVNVQVGYPAVSHPSTGYIYISKWWDCYVHYWEGTNNALMPWGSDPKIDADRYTTICGNNYWYFPVIATYNKFIAKDKAGDPKNTTGDQETTNHGGMYITHNGSNWVWGNFATYTIAYAGGDGSTGGPMASHTGLCPGSSQQLTANAFSKAYHTFNGWSDGNGHTYADQAMIENIQSNINLTAQWRDLASYTVNFSADNGTVAGGTAQTVYEEGKLTFPNVTSTTCGTFIGWVEAAYDNTAAPSGATFHAAGSQIDVVAELEGKTYYAVYRVATGMATTLTDNLVPSDFKATGTSYEATNNLVKTSSATYEAVTAKGNNAIQINKISDGRGIVSKISGGIFKGITLTTNANHSASRKVYVYGSSSYTAAYADPAAFNTNSEVRGTLLATLAGDTKTYSTSTDDYEYIAIFADGAAYLDQISLTWYGAPMKYQTSPTCSPMVGVESNFSTFTYAYNAGPSASQSFTVSGSSLGADLVVTAPANYEVCKTADGTYTSTISYTPSDGAVANTTAYIRLAAGLNVGTYNYAAASGLQVTSTGAKTRTAALNGSVTKADCAITFTDFNAVDHYEATLEYGSRVTVSYNYTYNGDGNFSISRSPATGTINKANKTLTVSTAGIWTLNASATAGTNYSKPSDASAQIRVKCVDTYKDFIHNKTIKAYGSGTAVTDGKMEDWGSGYTVPYIDDNAEETSGSCQQTHYKFMGWVSEDDINIADGTFKTGWTLIQAGTESKLATTKTYYAVWAKLEE